MKLLHLTIPLFAKMAVSLGLLVYLLHLLDWSQVGQLNPTSMLYILLGSTGTFFLLLFMAERWRLILKTKTINPLTLGEAYRGYLIGVFFNHLLPGTIGGDVSRIERARRLSGLALTSSGTVVLIERAAGLTALALLFLVGLDMSESTYPVFHGVQVHRAATAFGMLGIVVLWIIGVRRFGLSTPLGLAVLGLSLAAQGTDAAISFIILSHLETSAEPQWILIAMPISIFVTLAPVSLGGLGLREGTLAGALALFGVPTSIAVLFSLMIYLSKLPVGLFGGLQFMFDRQHRD